MSVVLLENRHVALKVIPSEGSAGEPSSLYSPWMSIGKGKGAYFGFQSRPCALGPKWLVDDARCAAGNNINCTLRSKITYNPQIYGVKVGNHGDRSLVSDVHVVLNTARWSDIGPPPARLRRRLRRAALSQSTETVPL